MQPLVSLRRSVTQHFSHVCASIHNAHALTCLVSLNLPLKSVDIEINVYRRCFYHPGMDKFRDAHALVEHTRYLCLSWSYMKFVGNRWPSCTSAKPVNNLPAVYSTHSISAIRETNCHRI